jgi:putative glutamine amidotransferase
MVFKLIHMKNFRLIIISLFILLIVKVAHSQHFAESGIDPKKTYILLAHPTVHNLKTIDFLLSNSILKPGNAEFIGIYPTNENYDYEQSIKLIKQAGMNRFHLQQIDVSIPTDSCYYKNRWTATFKKLFDHSAGIIFFGGPDIQPEIYGQKNSYSEVTDPNRHLFELSLLFHLIGGRQNEAFDPFLTERPDYFITGFCLGLQSMNVAAGGTLTQDIPAMVYEKKTAEEILKLKKDQLHRNYWQEISNDSLLMGINFHPIQYTAHPFFLKTVKADKEYIPLVLSSHHQAIDELGKDLIVTATSMDGQIIEGIHHRRYPNVFAVQFHPEVPALYTKDDQLKFAPSDSPKTFFEILSEADRTFHLKYWNTISKSILASEKEKKKK